MFRVIGCITQEHDLRLVLLAGVLCLFACCTAMSQIARARASQGRGRALWILGAGFVAGCGIWATHFVAMLAYQPGFAFGYDLTPTILSVLIAIALCSAGFALAVMRNPFFGGALAGSAIGIMHYVGMEAVRAPAREIWDFRYVTASLLIGILAMAFAMRLVLRGQGLRSYFTGALIFTLAICTLHFTGMAALSFSYDPLIQAGAGILEPTTLAVAIAAVAVLILGIGLIMSVVDHHLAERASGEAERLRLHISELEATKAELEQSLRDRAIALTKADAASKSKSAFLATMSHELRTPLNAIIGFSEVMSIQAFGPIGDPHYKSYAQDINDSGKHLLALISDILDLSRLDAGKADLNEEAIPVGAVVAECTRMVERQAQDGRLTLVRDIPADLPRVLADERRIKQVLINLLTNAVKFTPPGGQVTVSARQTPEGLVITVADTGIGIAADQIARAFESFGQIDSSIARKHHGAGLGLPLARQLMELHGGSLHLESILSEGTTVTAMLPATRILARAKSTAA